MKLHKITRRFSSLLSALQTLEAEGKMDLSFNRELAIRDAKNADYYSKVTVLELDSVLHIIVRAPDGMLCMTKFEPFFSCMHDGPLALMVPSVDGKVTDKLEEANELKEIGNLANTPAGRKLIADGNLIGRA